MTAPTKPLALVVRGGWSGHQPVASTDRFIPVLRDRGFAIEISDSLDAYADARLMQRANLILQMWTDTEDPSRSPFSADMARNLHQAVTRGAGFTGWHGGIIDSFPASRLYHELTGAQFLNHPGDCIDFQVNIAAWDDPVVSGIGNFRVSRTEQYNLLVHPGNLVLATSTFCSGHAGVYEGMVMPAIWKRRCGAGRVFISAIGHQPSDFDNPALRTVTERGILWAAGVPAGAR